MRVLKFGESLVKDAECIRADRQIVSERNAVSNSVAVVVSALGGATDDLMGEASPRSLDRNLSFGEGLSSSLVAAAMRVHGLDAEACDARKLIVTAAGVFADILTAVAEDDGDWA